MAFRRKMHDAIDLLAKHHIGHRRLIADVDLVKSIARIASNLRERNRTRGIGELIDIDNPDAEIAHQMTADRRTNKSRPAGDQNLHQFPSSPYRNPLSTVANAGALRSLSDRTGAAPPSGQSIPISG